MAIRCAVKAYNPCHIITSPIEHHCVSHTTEALGKEGVVKLHYVNVDEQGRFDLTHLEELLATIGERCLVSLMHANNEIGTIQPIEEIGSIAEAADIYFHSDGVQSTGKIPVDVKKLKVDLYSISSHKIHGPKGVGALYVRKGTTLRPMLFGGSHERSRRAGTENVPGIVALGRAAELAGEPGAHPRIVPQWHQRAPVRLAFGEPEACDDLGGQRDEALDLEEVDAASARSRECEPECRVVVRSEQPVLER
jgi:cysteine desulfurase